MALKNNIIKTLFLLILWFLPISSYAADVEEEIKALSSAKFWAKVNNINLQDEEQEYIICGQSICQNDKKNDDWQKCIVKVTQRNDLATQASKAAQIVGTTTVVAGGGVAATGIGAVPGTVLMAAGAKVFTLGAAIEVLAGTGTVTRYEYKCLDNRKTIPEDWQEAPEGGFVQKVKHRTGGWLAKAKTKEESCYEANDGNKYCLLTKDKEGKDQKATVVYNNKGTAFKGCEVLPVKLYNNRRCFFCSLFTISVKVANDMAAKSFKTFAKAFSLLIAVGLALWVAVQVLLQVSSVTKQDAPKFLTNLLKQCYKFVIAFLLLQNSSYLFENAISPFISAGIELGTVMVGEEQFSFSVKSDKDDPSTKMDDQNPGISMRANSINSDAGYDQYFSSELYIQLDNFIARLQRKLTFMQSVGTSLLCIGNNAMLFKGSTLKFGDGFQLVIEGFLLAGFGFLMALAFAFYMVDAIVQIAIVAALMPFLIASWPFKLTSKYTQTGWSIFLNSVFLLMFSGLIINVGYNLVDSALKYTAETSEVSSTYDDIEQKEDEEQTLGKKEIEMGTLYEIAQAINKQNEDELSNATDISTIGFLILLFCCIFAFELIGRIKELAGKFSSGALSPIASPIATMGGSAAKSLALKSTQSFRESVDNKVKGATRGVIRFGVDAIVHPQQTGRRVLSGIKKIGKGTVAVAKDVKYKAQSAGASIKNKFKRNRRTGS